MEELNIEEMIALTGGGHRKKDHPGGTSIEVGDITQSNTAYVSQSNDFHIG
jgi:hypothetical protein